MRRGRKYLNLNLFLCFAIISSSFVSWSIGTNQVSAAVDTESVNLALGKTVTASSSLSQHSPSYMVDGSMDTMWSTSDTGQWTSPITDEWAMVDLGEDKDITRWVVKSGGPGALVTSDFQLEYSTAEEGEPWQTADTVSGNTAEFSDRNLTEPIHARYVRLHVTKKTSDGVEWPAVRISEFELYSTAVSIPVLTADTDSGTVVKGTKVKLNASLPTAVIYYTTDGSDPTTSTTKLMYSEPLTIESDITIMAVAMDETSGAQSELKTFTYRLAKEEAPAVNLALGKSVTASSSLPQHSPSFMTDGSTSTMWSTSDTGFGTNPITDEWAVVDLGDQHDIARWIVKHAGGGSLNTRDFQLEYSSGDGNGPWLTADTVINNTIIVTDRVLATPIHARYVRLHVTKKAAEGSDWPAVRIGELELYATTVLVPKLTASPESGTVIKGKKVTLSSSLPSASIYYTADGSDPRISPSRLLYSEPLTINNDVSINAVAIDEIGGNVGEMQSLTYKVQVVEDVKDYPNLASGSVATMTAAAGWGNVAGRAIDGSLSTYAQPEKFGLWDLIVDFGKLQPVNYAVLRKNPDHQNYITQFTIDVSENGNDWTTVVTENSNKDTDDQMYKFPAKNARYVRLHQIAHVGGAAAIWEFELYNTSNAMPVQIEMLTKDVSEGTLVGLSASEPNASIYYTTDGSDPLISDSRKLYEGQFPLIGNGVDAETAVTLKAYAKVDGKADSIVTSYSYQVVALSTDPASGTVAENTEVALLSSVTNAVIHYTTDGTDPKTSATKQTYSNPIAVRNDLAIRAYVAVGSKASKVLTFPFSLTQSVTNAALGKQATASSEEEANPASHAVDGQLETSWTSNNSNKNSWLQVDLGQSYELTGTEVTWKEDNKNYKYKIEVSSDALNWYPAVDRLSYAGRSGVLADSFLDAARRYVRITVTDFEIGSKAGIKEFKVLGYPSEAMPALPVGPSTNGWSRPVIAPMPLTVAGVHNPIINLSGTWKFTQAPAQGFWKNNVEPSAWADAKVPANLEVIGFDIRSQQGGDWFPDRNVENVYKKSIMIPEDYQGQKTMLRFEAAFDYARIWVNGHLVRTHRGGFTTFDCDITDYVTPGESAWITVGITAEKGFVEYQHVRGLVGEVKMFALPVNYLTRLQAETEFDSTYTDATLKVSAGMIFDSSQESLVNLELVDPDGHTVPIAPGTIPLSAANPDSMISIPVKNPQKWDAEHPNLYKLTANVTVNGEIVQTVVRKIGFRSIKVDGNKMFVNGKEVKLRGVNWHQSSPLAGVAVDIDHDKESLLKLKDGNINYIRASHWPQFEYVLDYADEIGLYVEQENSVMFINDSRLSDSNYLSYFMGQFSETIEKDRSHPSIVIWSLGNESSWGSNVAATHDYVKAIDPTRPVKFSFGVNAPSQYNDLFSVHYGENGLKFGGGAKPDIRDEYAHLFMYYGSWNSNDPSFQDFYGESIKRYWDHIYDSEGALGGAIWHSRDITTFCEEKVCGFNAKWGLMDSWNREKPEYWNVKKAYSPIRIETNTLPNPGKGNELQIPIENRYNHTNLNEIKVEWTINGQSGILTGPAIEPMSSGSLVIPARSWKLGDTVHLKFYQSDRYKTDRLVDEYNLTIGEKTFHFKEAQGQAPDIQNDDSAITLTGEDFSLTFNKATGMIKTGIYKGETILTGGPYLNMGFTSSLDAWTLSSITSTSADNEAIVNIAGNYGNTGVTFTLHVDGAGLIKTTYTVSHLPATYDAIGVAFDVSAAADRITWNRNGQWSYYPEDQIGRNEGTAFKTSSEDVELYGIKPTRAWSQDEKDFNTYGKDDKGQRGTNDFVASKNNFNFASLLLGESGKRLTVHGDGNGSVKGSVLADGTVRLAINNIWSHPAAYPGWLEANSVSKLITLAATYTNSVSMRLDDHDDYTVRYSDAASYLSDLNWVSATTGWGEVKKNASIQGNVLTVFDGMGSKSYEKGIGTHANSEIVYDLDGKGYEIFESYVGVDQESTQGLVTFQVWADGEKLFESDKMGIRSVAQKVSVNIAGKHELKLIVTDGGNGTSSDHADWADAKLFKSAVVVAPSTDATLNGIVMNGQSLAGFQKDKLTYNVALPAGTLAVPSVYATAADSNAALKVTPAIALPGTTTIQVKAEDGITILTYMINFTVTPGTTDPEGGKPSGGTTDPEGGKSTGGTTGEPKWPSKEQQVVDKLKVTNGEAVVTLQKGITEVLIPVPSEALKGLGKIVFQGEDISVELPGAVIAQLISLASEGKKAYVSFKFTKVAETEAERLLNKAASNAHAAITPIGNIYDLSIGIVGSDGKTVKLLTEFVEPILLKLKVNGAVNQNLTGIYYVKDNGKLEYVGGRTSNGMIEALIHHFSKYGLLTYDKSFTDVSEQHWASDVIQRMAAHQVVTGVNDTEFAPKANVTRAEFASVLVRALGLQSTGTTPFTDLKKDVWYTSAVEAAYKAGIVTGRSQTQFAPDATITREEMAVMIIRAYEVKTGKKVDTTSKQSQFADDHLISGRARGSVQAAFDLLLLKGRGSNQFIPKGVTNRAESVQVIANVLE